MPSSYLLKIIKVKKYKKYKEKPSTTTTSNIIICSASLIHLVGRAKANSHHPHNSKYFSCHHRKHNKNSSHHPHNSKEYSLHRHREN